jgi:hypothetical protein
MSKLKEFEHALLIEKVASRYVSAMEFDTEEAKKKYLKEHPDADRSKHTVKKKEEKSKAKQEHEEFHNGLLSGIEKKLKHTDIEIPKDPDDAVFAFDHRSGLPVMFNKVNRKEYFVDSAVSKDDIQKWEELREKY